MFVEELLLVLDFLESGEVVEVDDVVLVECGADQDVDAVDGELELARDEAVDEADQLVVDLLPLRHLLQLRALHEAEVLRLRVLALELLLAVEGKALDLQLE